MKSSELRIGNFIRLIENKKIVKCDSETIYQGVDGSFEGIPLTEEWLKKFSTDSRTLGNNMSFGNGGILHRISNGYNFIVQGYLIARVPYVHSLQNLYFALTGEELITPKT